MFFYFAEKEIDSVLDAINHFTKTSWGRNQDNFAVKAIIETPDRAWAMDEVFAREGLKYCGCEKLFQS